MRMNVAFLCGLVAVICIVLGLLEIYTGGSVLPGLFTFTPRALLLGAGVALLFGINWSLGKLSSK